MSSDTPSQARPRQQQISPSMRPMASADNGSSAQSAGATAAPAPTDPPPTPPGPTPMDTTGGPTNETAAVPATVANAAAEGSAHQQQPASQRADTIKRRNSPSTAPMAQNPATGSKRARPAAPAPKVLPQRYELCSVEDIVILIAHMLGELIETNDPLALQSGNLTRFHSRTAPGISVLDYLNRLARHATLSPPLLLAMVYYIDRLCALYPDFTINTLTVHRFLITAATVAAKGLSDSFWNNSTYARVGGVKLAELRLLELEFLYRVDWKIVPNPEVLVAYYRGLVERAPGYVLEGEEGQDDEELEDGDEEDSDDIGDDDDLITDEPQTSASGSTSNIAQTT
ncbi:uncharacterized protein E0L32_008037 [Thyridium curvatum]|uniref:Nuc-1 negative regulatory protein preg n=1 Tax=Thyridium curvatum TaxID=1093900 RepID=A0A507B343_9PEZI|nr:uncharacterized protein E0L32_008037 [Thyridium curvatum]TPX11000.1 hypothetical protein E0L32_008037 [Thyridium curvatum]